jgi:exodeoxyribonuclease V alpha subunit
MKPRLIELSPLGTALAAVGNRSIPELDLAILEWLRQVRENLRTCYNIDDEVGFLAWELARWQPGLELTERQALILLILSALVQVQLGSTRVTFEGAPGRALRLELADRLLTGVRPMAGYDSLEPSQAADLMEKLVTSGSAGLVIGDEGSFRPLIIAGSHLYLQKMLQLEDQFVEVVRRRLSTDFQDWSEPQIDRALSDVLSRPVMQNTSPVVLEREQQDAVKAAVRSPMTIVSGGPGTGKTTIIVSMLRVLRRLGVTCDEITLAAPTGRAANRMGEAIRVSREAIVDPAEADHDLAHLGEPRTLHRLLGFSPRSGRFLHHENNRISERIIIVDEASMVDLALMEHLVQSLREDARLILLGDARQLPSIEAGAVLRDLLGEGIDSSGTLAAMQRIRLIRSHRMRHEDNDGRNIFTVAQAIDEGRVPDFAARRAHDDVITERLLVRDIEFRGVEFVRCSEGSDVLRDFLDRWYQEMLGSLPELDQLVGREYSFDQGIFASDDQKYLQQLFAHWKRSRVLCITRVLPTGADRINETLHELAILRYAQSKQRVGGLVPRHYSELIPGEPVMMTVNDYERKIFNGDQGVVVSISERGRLTLMAVFPQSQGMIAFPAESLRPHLRHSYAMTVHKAQGSEFDRVAIILPDHDLPITTREILYTALTRSRNSAVLVGRRDILVSGIARKISRESGIADKLREIPDPGTT